MRVEIGFSLSGPDNGLHFYERADVPACAACGLVTDSEWVNPTLRMRRRRLDFSSTYDGQHIVSERFRQFVESIPGIRFSALPNDAEFFVPIVAPIIEFDTESAPPKQGNWCENCERWTQIANGGLIVVTPGTVLPHGFSRPDQVYGSATGHTPPSPVLQDASVLVSHDVGELLREQNFVGLDLKPVVDDLAKYRGDRGLG